ncbi:MAG: hypothetical protein EOP84_27825 [Verrucomicrobiaceae bacterium]|nr:MAG: hypothetical protein EOP84_27825 [Verrucomicrobiaceae bacterium]
MKLRFLTSLFAILSAGTAFSAVTVTSLGPDLYLANVTLQVQVTSTFSVGHIITVEDFYASNSGGGESHPSNSTMTVAVNGEPATTLALTTNSGVYDTYGFWDANDFALSWDAGSMPSYSVGDTLTFSGSFNFNYSGTLVQGTGTALPVYLSSNDFDNSVALATGSTSAVPETSSALLAAAGCALVVMRRARRN